MQCRVVPQCLCRAGWCWCGPSSAGPLRWPVCWCGQCPVAVPGVAGTGPAAVPGVPGVAGTGPAAVPGVPSTGPAAVSRLPAPSSGSRGHGRSPALLGLSPGSSQWPRAGGAGALSPSYEGSLHTLVSGTKNSGFSFSLSSFGAWR